MSAPETPLYRQGYLDAQRARLDGVILIPASLPIIALAWASITLLAALIAFITLGTYTRKARLDGLVMPSAGVIKITAQTEGRIEQLFAAEGQTLAKGAPLYQLSGEKYDGNRVGALAELRLSLARQQEMLRAQQQQQAASVNAQLTGAALRLVSLKTQFDSAVTAHGLAGRQAELLRASQAPYAELAEKGFISAQDWRQKQIDLAGADARVEETAQLRQRLEQEISSVRTEQTRLQQDGLVQQTELARQLQSIGQQQTELASRAHSTVTAPIAGTLAAVMARPGQMAAAGEALAIVVPAGAQMQVELYAPSKSVGFIKIGARVGLRFAAYPHEKFGVQYGKVRSISRVALTPADVVLRAPFSWQSQEAHYRVVIALEKPGVTAYGREEPLTAGMAVAGDVALDTRRLYEWALEPLWSLRGKL